jgi:hypothetical protein
MLESAAGGAVKVLQIFICPVETAALAAVAATAVSAVEAIASPMTAARPVLSFDVFT